MPVNDEKTKPINPWDYKEQILNGSIKIRLSKTEKISGMDGSELEKCVSGLINEKSEIREMLMKRYPHQAAGGFGGIHPFWKECSENLLRKLGEAKKLIDIDEDKENIVGYLMINFDPGIVLIREGGHGNSNENFYGYLCGSCDSGLRKVPLSVHVIAVSDEFDISRLGSQEELRLLSRTDAEINPKYMHKGAVAMVGLGCLCGAHFVVAKDVYIKTDKQQMVLGYSKKKLTYTT